MPLRSTVRVAVAAVFAAAFMGAADVHAASPAACGPGDLLETGLQGQIPGADRATGRAAAGYTCNLREVGFYPSTSFANFDTYGNCAYYSDTIGLYSAEGGTIVLDVSDPRKPVKTDYLTARATRNAGESLRVGERTAPVDDRQQRAGLGLNRHVGVRRVTAPGLDPAIRDGHTETVLAETQVDAGVEFTREIGPEQRAERDDMGIEAHPRAVDRRGGVGPTPATKRHDDRLELLALGRQLVDLRGGRRRQRPAAHHVSLLEVAQPLGQHIGAQARKALAEVGEALRAEEQLADDHEGPALADEVQRTGHAAGVPVGALRGHGADVTHLWSEQPSGWSGFPTIC